MLEEVFSWTFRAHCKKNIAAIVKSTSSNMIGVAHAENVKITF